MFYRFQDNFFLQSFYDHIITLFNHKVMRFLSLSMFFFLLSLLLTSVFFVFDNVIFIVQPMLLVHLGKRLLEVLLELSLEPKLSLM